MSMIDLEYAIAMMAIQSIEDFKMPVGFDFPVGFADKPETWKSSLSSAYTKNPQWFQWAITEYLKGR